MKLGKLTPDTLEALLSRVPISDPRVILGPKVGEDAALLDFGDEVLVAKTDPITFATDLIGWYAVHVNANDVACAGAKPRWFMATLLLPQQMNEEKVSEIFRQITDACDSLGVTLVGGHTEVTQNLDQSIIVGCMLGVASKDRALTTGGAQVGDYVILTKGVSWKVPPCWPGNRLKSSVRAAWTHPLSRKLRDCCSTRASAWSRTLASPATPPTSIVCTIQRKVSGHGASGSCRRGERGDGGGQG